MFDLRLWQREASLQFLESDQPDFLARITPGGGKTFWALKMAVTLLGESVDTVAVIVPSVVIKRQWQEDARKHFGLILSDIEDWNDESHGFITTYQKIATGQMPEVMRQFCEESRVFAIFDEIHHGSDHNTWGQKLRTAFELAARRLCLTGTPFRSDGREVPFVRYQDEVCCPDYSYVYSQAVSHDIVRQLRFQLVDGIASWQVDGDSRDELLSESESSSALNAALDPDKDFVVTMIEAAELKRRELTPQTACLVLAKDTEHASALAKVVRRVTGHKPVLVHSKTDSPAQRLDAFRESDSPWIVSVRMVSEGVDIPRIQCLCWLTNYSTELFFEQAVARCVRGRAHEEAWIFLPETPKLVEYARGFESAELPALKPVVDESKSGPVAVCERQKRTIEYLDSEGFLTKVISAGTVGRSSVLRVASEERLERQRERNRAYYQNPKIKERICEQKRAYHQKPEVKERKRAYYQKPEVKERKRAYYQKPEVKERKRAYHQKPEVKERKRVYQLRKRAEKAALLQQQKEAQQQ